MDIYNKYIVRPVDLQCAENCFQMHVKQTDDPKAHPEIAAITIALLNSHGGILTILNKTTTSEDGFTEWSTKLKDLLETHIPSDILYGCIHMKLTQKGCIQLLVKFSPRAVTFRSHLTTRWGATTVNCKDSEPIKSLLFGTLPCDEHPPLELRHTYRYEEKLPHNESDNVECKHWETKCFNVLLKRLRSPRMIAALLAMPNVPGGGSILLGVEESSNALLVKGIALIKDQFSELERAIQSLLETYFSCGQNEPTLISHERIWGEQTHQPTKNDDWRVTYHRVLDAPDNEIRHMVRIHLNYMPGGVFHKRPESFFLDDYGCVQQMTLDQWKASTQLPCHCSWRPLAPCVLQDTSAKVNADEYENGKDCMIDDDKDQINQKLQEQHSILWTEHRKDWSMCLINETATAVEHSTTDNDIRMFTERLTFIPSRDHITKYGNNAEAIDVLLSEIERKHSGEKGFVIASRHLFGKTKSCLQRPNHHGFDIISFSEGKSAKICVWVVASSAINKVEEAELWEYMMKTGLSLKKFIQYETRVSVCVQCALCTVDGKLKRGDLENLSVNFFRASGSETAKITKALTSVLLKVDIRVQTRLAEQQLIQFSRHQTRCILGTDITQVTFIEGPPGSGKSMLAFYLCLIFRMVTYICTRKPFKNFVDFQKIANTRLVQTKSELLSLVNSGDLDYPECIILDDSHNLPCSSSDWKEVFDKLDLQNKNLFITVDARVQNISNDQDMNNLESIIRNICKAQNLTYQSRQLTEVFRNSRKVVSFMKTCFEDDAKEYKRIKIAQTQTIDGDDVELRVIPNIRGHVSNGLVAYLNTIMSGEIGYTASDITILVDGPRAEEDAIFFKDMLDGMLPGTRVQRAEDFPVKGIVVETLDNFNGLDTGVCVFIVPQSAISTDISAQQKCLSNPKYKALIASRGLLKMAFLFESPLNYELATQMKFLFYKDRPQCSRSPLVDQEERPCETDELLIGDQCISSEYVAGTCEDMNKMVEDASATKSNQQDDSFGVENDLPSLEFGVLMRSTGMVGFTGHNRTATGTRYCDGRQALSYDELATENETLRRKLLEVEKELELNRVRQRLHVSRLEADRMSRTEDWENDILSSSYSSAYNSASVSLYSSRAASRSPPLTRRKMFDQQTYICQNCEEMFL